MESRRQTQACALPTSTTASLFLLQFAIMKPTIFLIGVLLSLSLGGRAFARATSGEEILSKCQESAEAFDNGFCAGFMDATLDTLNMWEASDISKKRSHDNDVHFCVPDKVTNGQLLRVFVKYLEDHPEELHKPANLLLVEAFRKAFPCQQ